MVYGYVVKHFHEVLDIRYKLFLRLKCLYIVIRWRKAYNMRYAISYIKYPDEADLKKEAIHFIQYQVLLFCVKPSLLMMVLLSASPKS